MASVVYNGTNLNRCFNFISAIVDLIENSLPCYNKFNIN